MPFHCYEVVEFYVHCPSAPKLNEMMIIDKIKITMLLSPRNSAKLDKMFIRFQIEQISH